MFRMCNIYFFRDHTHTRLKCQNAKRYSVIKITTSTITQHIKTKLRVKFMKVNLAAFRLFYFFNGRDGDISRGD